MLRNFFHEESRISRGKLSRQFTDVRVRGGDLPKWGPVQSHRRDRVGWA